MKFAEWLAEVSGEPMNQFRAYDDRVSHGKGVEDQIYFNMVACGMKLRKPSSREDMYDKIDAWWNTGKGEEPIQIKYRDTGYDILFEVIKDIRRGIPGRDMISKAKYYAVLINGTVTIVSVDEAKKMIEKAVEAADEQGFDDRGNFKHGSIMLRIRPDPASRQEKLIAFVPKNSLVTVKVCAAKKTF